MTVQLPIFNEIYVAERLLRSVSQLDYPRDRLQIQVLDDSTDDTREITADCAAELRERGFDVELIHRTDRTDSKPAPLSGASRPRGRIRLYPRRRFCSTAAFAPQDSRFLYRSESGG